MRTRFTLPILLLAFVILMSCTVTPVAADGELSVCRGDNLELSIRLLSNGSYGNPLVDQIVSFYDQSEDFLIGKTITDSEGYASIDWKVPADHPLGETIVNATYLGNESEFLTPTSQFAVVTVLASSFLDVSYDRNSYAPGDILGFSVALHNDTGDPISSANVYVLSDDVKIDTKLTNESGEVIFDIPCNDTWLEFGENILKIVYEGNTTLYVSSSEESITVDFTKLPTSISFQSPPTKYNTSQLIRFSANIASAGSPLSDAEIDVYLDSEFLFSLLSNSSGFLNVCIEIDSRVELGQHRIDLIYPSTTRYLTSEAGHDFEVYGTIDCSISLSKSPTLGQFTNLTVKMTDDLSRPITYSSIVIQDYHTGDSFEYVSELNETYFLFNITFNGNVGPRNLTLILGGNDYLTNLPYVFEVEVWTQPRFTVISSNIDGYSSLGQEVILNLHLGDSKENYSSRIVTLHNSNSSVLRSYTDTSGQVTFTLQAPNIEGFNNLFLVYVGNITKFERNSTCWFSFVTARQIPVIVELKDYYISTPLQQITVHLKVFARNGSVPIGLELDYSWLSISGRTHTSEDGSAILYLAIPTEEGDYLLSYSIKQEHRIQFNNGTIIIQISQYDAVASQGVGMPIIITSICSSLGIALIPLARRRYLIG